MYTHAAEENIASTTDPVITQVRLFSSLALCLCLCSTVERLGAKQLVMQYLTHPDPNVRYEALIAVQKMMVHNW